MAQQWADHLLQQSHLSNSGYVYRGMKVGENLGSRWSNGPMEHNCKDLIEHWYQESEKYKFNSEPDSIQGIVTTIKTYIFETSQNTVKTDPKKIGGLSKQMKT
uniref:SCP domain-containing protein n=1 Tax=Schistosoma haematobium TaxID=6185 RepID=A0A095B523_SCHHA